LKIVIPAGSVSFLLSVTGAKQQVAIFHTAGVISIPQPISEAGGDPSMFGMGVLT